MRYYIDLFGCAKNQVDAERMMSFLDGAGWSPAGGADDAELIIVNSCGFIEAAKRESINAVLAWRRLYPGKKILLAGCLAQRYAKELSESLPEADGLFGVDDISGIAAMANSLAAKKNPPRAKRSPVPFSSRPLLSLPGSAYVKISEGCGNRCAYCAIPLIRGPLRCRSVPDILEECRGLLERGIRELCIIGQDIGSYASGSSGLPELLGAIAGLPGRFWVRLLYMHPDHFLLPVLDLMERDPRFLPYFDIPFQHASQKILSAMNRRGTSEKYLELAETVRKRLPASVIRSTFLLGFPGETEEDFSSLLDFQEKLSPDWLGCITFSREEGTPAYAMKGRVPKKTAAARKREIEERQTAITGKRMDRFTGRELDVLLEERIDNYWLGRLYCHAPEVDGAAVIAGPERPGVKAGEIAPCRVIARRGFDLEIQLTEPFSKPG
ncbi:MAG: 30S ribosomal protein S12 methylthiotransferase RimO [Treponema sp.]|nr:30S ribosomal protein S12 methylthiotransferase RimO [Treponema sp.]